MKTTKTEIIRYYLIVWFIYASLRFIFNWIASAQKAISGVEPFEWQVLSIGSIVLLLLFVFLCVLCAYRLMFKKISAWKTVLIVSIGFCILLLKEFLTALSDPVDNLGILLLFLVNVLNAGLSYYTIRDGN